jgi:hypothetical protein
MEQLAVRVLPRSIGRDTPEDSQTQDLGRAPSMIRKHSTEDLLDAQSAGDDDYDTAGDTGETGLFKKMVEAQEVQEESHDSFATAKLEEDANAEVEDEALARNKKKGGARRNECFVPREGIDREVIMVDICSYLSDDALVRPGQYEVSYLSFSPYNHSTSRAQAGLVAQVAAVLQSRVKLNATHTA